MVIDEFVHKFQNHPILFVGTGISLRYLENSFSWEGLLKKISEQISGNSMHFQDLKRKVYCNDTKSYNYSELACLLEREIDDKLEYRPGFSRSKFTDKINDIYYKSMEKGVYTSRLKIYISEILKDLVYRKNMSDEISELKKMRKNIGSVITTNYDRLIEDVFNFNPLIGNNILLSNPYGSVYKIHGSVTDHNSIVITSQDYSEFNIKYELIRAQLISLFIHNPVIFLGYSISDDNIKQILKTIFSYVDHVDDLSRKIRSNFLLVEYDQGSKNDRVTEYDVNIGNITIRINKISTDDYLKIYTSISDLRLPISAMEVRKVRDIVADIYRGGRSDNIPKVRITEDVDELNNSDKVLVIGTEKTITYEFRTIKEMILDYFNIIEENNFQILDTIDKQCINSNQYFPIFAFSKINNRIRKTDELKSNQKEKIEFIKGKIPDVSKVSYSSIDDIYRSELSDNNRHYCLIWNVFQKNINMEDFKQFILSCKGQQGNKPDLLTNYRRLICVYDYCSYN